MGEREMSVIPFRRQPQATRLRKQVQKLEAEGLEPGCAEWEFLMDMVGLAAQGSLRIKEQKNG